MTLSNKRMESVIKPSVYGTIRNKTGPLLKVGRQWVKTLCYTTIRRGVMICREKQRRLKW
jgi:hypothetical protein